MRFGFLRLYFNFIIYNFSDILNEIYMISRRIITATVDSRLRTGYYIPGTVY